MDWIGLDWIGLDWNGLDWTDLKDNEFHWIVLSWLALNWRVIDFDCVELFLLKSIALNCIEPAWNRIKLNPDWSLAKWVDIELTWIELHWNEQMELDGIEWTWIALNALNCIGLNWLDLTRLERNWTELVLIETNWIGSNGLDW